MSKDKKAGALIITVAITLMAVALVLSRGWGKPSVILHFLYGEDYDFQIIPTSYVLAPLMIVAGYGVARYLSLIPPLFRRRQESAESQEKES